MPAFPTDGSSAAQFVAQVTSSLDYIQDRFDSVWVDDHLLPWANFVAPATPTFECTSTLAFLAAAYPRLDFGTSVLCQSFRHPALTARIGAGLQLLTGGRFILGIGAGWLEREYRAFGHDFPKAAVRVAQLEEAVQIIRVLWTEAPASFAGRFYRVDEAYCEPRPDPAPPILIGGGGERLMLRVVARHADWWNLTGGSVENYARKLSVLSQYCAEEGRDYGEIVKTWSAELVAVAEDEREARRVASAAPYRNDHAIVGTPEQVTEQLRPFAQLNVEHLILRFVDFPSTAGAELFADAVMPSLG
jgi:alkanesulfonate monooxygenase SsuD/methylene tetrahydromethanopterin reductase-like flavin-dependent oxidoreductase (luciferase family)